MMPADFIRKWKDISLSERSAYQQHFLDLCALVGHPTPAEADTSGESFTFERGAEKQGAGRGWADVWKRGFFGWEYKKPGGDLRKAFDQLLLYHEALENPPLLVVSDMLRVEVHTNFTGTRSKLFAFSLEEVEKPENLEVLRAVFFEPEKLKPGETVEAVTAEAARHVAEIAENLRRRLTTKPPHEEAAAAFGEIARSLRAVTGDSPLVARFIDRLVFCMFAEDIGLLPENVFADLLKKSRGTPAKFARYLGQLFEAMRDGGDFLLRDVRRFNGNLFADIDVLDLTEAETELVYQAARLDWAVVDPSIFGTLFERGLDPSKRTQLGAHYTSRQDIQTLVEPVVMAPLRREWAKARDAATKLLAGADTRRAREKAAGAVSDYVGYLGSVRVLDPACGSGNFLYVTLQLMKDLEKEAILWAAERGLQPPLPLVHPRQFYGIEISPYAFDLAQMTLWIGYLQWTRNNGYGSASDPILESLEGNFRNGDAILDLSDPENPREPEWPAVDFIVGNPPFLGNKRMRAELGNDYCEALWRLYKDRIPAMSDLCCYWFEKARAQIERGRCKRTGLLATTAIKQVGSRPVLQRVKSTTNLFFAISDRDWVLDGAATRICMVGFGDNLGASSFFLDGEQVPEIHSSLTAGLDLTAKVGLKENANRAFMGTTKVGAFDIGGDLVVELLRDANPHGRPNSDVLRPFVNGSDLVRTDSRRWVIDFGVNSPFEQCALYQSPFQYLARVVKPKREENKDPWRREHWWLLGRNISTFRSASRGFTRYIGTPCVSKHRIFVWLDQPTLPDAKVIAFAFQDDYHFGLLHSRHHEVWTRATCGWHGVGNDVTYNPTTCFETFPFPWPPGKEPQEDPRVQAIAAAAKDLSSLREAWLNPPEWTKTDVLQFPGSLDGPWARFVVEPDARGIGTVRYPRLVPKDEACAALLKKRTLTALYNQRPAWLDLAHKKLDAAVAAAYGWPADLNDEQILEGLLALNLQRAGA